MRMGMVSHMCVVDLPGALDARADDEPQRDIFWRGVSWHVSLATDSTVPLYSGTNLSLEITSKRSLSSGGGSALMTSKMQVP